MKKVLARRAWSDHQRKWLERIAKQLKLEVIVDRQAFEVGELRAAQALGQLAGTCKGKRLHLEQIDGQPASSSAWAPLLQKAGFKTDWLHLVLYAPCQLNL